MRLINLALASVGMLFAMNAHATLIEYYDFFQLRPFASSTVEFQGDIVVARSPIELLSLPQFDSSLGTLQSVQLEFRSILDADGGANTDDFTGQANDAFGTLHIDYHPIFGPYFYYENDAELSYRVSAILSLDALFPNISTVALGISASASCSNSEISILGLSTYCSANDADGFGVTGFDWDFTVSNTADFIGSGDLFFKALADSAFEGYCDYDDEDNDGISQTRCGVDPWFSWEGYIRVAYTYSDLRGDGDGGGVSVPEPAPSALLGIGIAGLLAARWRRRVRV